MSYDPNNPYGQQQPPPPPPPGPGPVDSGATSVFQPQQPPGGGYPQAPGGGYPPAPGAGYPQAPGGPPPGYGQQPPGYGQQPPGYGGPPGGPSPQQRIQQLGVAPQDWMILISTVVLLISLVLPWSDPPRGFDSINGFDDAVFPVSLGFLVAALLGAVPVVLRLMKQNVPAMLGFGSKEAEGMIGVLMVLGGVAWFMWAEDAGIGLWLTILAAFVWGGGAIWKAFAPPAAPAGGPGYPPSY
jgi:hypothetical protein